jgi:hypothetical protein
MTEAQTEAESGRPILVVALEGPFDAEDAEALGATLGGLPEGALTLDFTRCDPVRDRGLALLAVRLASLGRAVRLRGLGSHQRRLLRYLGLEAA